MNDWLDSLGNAAKAGANVYATATGRNNNIPAPATPAASGSPSWLPLALIGGVVVLVLVLFIGKK